MVFNQAKAKDYQVSNAQEISALKFLPGDKVIMKANADLKIQQIILNGAANFKLPITLID